MCDSEKSFSEMNEDGRSILLEYLDMIITKKPRGKKCNFPKTFIEATVGYIGNPSKNGALKDLGFFSEKEWKNTEYYPKFRWKWRTPKLKALWSGGSKPSHFKLKKVVSLCEEAGYEKEHPIIDRVIHHMEDTDGKHINIEKFTFLGG